MLAAKRLFAQVQGQLSVGSMWPMQNFVLAPDLSSAFDRLPPQQKEIFSLLLMYGLPVSMTAFANTIGFADLKNPATGKPLGATDLDVMFSAMKNKGLLEGAKGDVWRVVPAAQPLLHHPFVQSQFGSWLAEIQAAIAKAATHYYYYSISLRDDNDKKAYVAGLALQPLRLILADQRLSPEQRQAAFQQSIVDRTTRIEQAAALWIGLFDLDEGPAHIWGLLRDDQKFFALSYRHARVLSLGLPVDSLAVVSLEAMPPACRLLLAETYLLAGRSGDARSIIDSIDEAGDFLAWIASLRGLDKFLQGDKAGALEEFANAVALYKKQTRRRKDFFPYPAGMFYLLAMMQTDVDLYRAGIAQFLKTAKDELGYKTQHFRLLDLVFEREAEDDKEFRDVSESLASEAWLDGSLLEIVTYVVFRAWGKRAIKLKQSEAWRTVAAKLSDNGFAGLLEHLQQALSGDPRAALARPVPVHEDWQRVLMRLKGLTAPASAKKAGVQQGAETRLAWVIVNRGGRLPDIQPRLQKQNRDGSWSKGRNVALKRLATGQFDETELSATDRKVLSGIQVDSSYNGWGSETYYFVDAGKALPLLAGHPAAIAEDGRAVEIGVVSPDLVIQKGKGGSYAVAFSREIPTSPGVEVKRLDDHRYEVLQIDERHCQIAKTIGKQLVVPEKGVKELQELVPQLAPLVPVQSDLAGSGIGLETIPAADGLQVHLAPADDGFVAEFLVEPINGSNKFFHPGKGREHLIVEMGKNKVQTERDLKQERRLYDQVVQKLDLSGDLEEEPFQFFADGPQQCLELLEGLRQLNGDDVKVKWPEGEKLRLARRGEFSGVTLNIKSSGTDWFGVDGEIRLDDGTVMRMDELLRLVEGSSSRFLALGDEGFLALEQSLYRQLKQLSGIAEGGKVHALASSVLAEIAENAGKLKSSQHWRDMRQTWESSFDRAYPLPTTLQAELRDYQVTGFRWLARLASLDLGACLADDMGLGKTLQALALMLTRAAQGPMLVVAPVSVVPNWIGEIGRFAPTLNVKWMIGSAERRKKVLEDLQPFDVVLCSYGVLAPDEENLTKVAWDMVVLDEAQAIKNHTTKRAAAAFALQARFRLITTGTPMENHLGELWSLFRFIAPGFLGSFERFNQRFVARIEADADSAAKQHLKALIGPFILRRRKREVLEELPEKTEITLSVEMSAEERAFYETLRLKAIDNIAAASGEGEPTHVKILAEIMRLRRSCCHPKLVDPKIDIDGSKLAQLQELLMELRESGHKVLIFSQFVDHLAIIRSWLDDARISYQYLDGSTPVKQRQQAVQDFQNGIGDCFLISLKAGGSGLNLTAANYVIHMDPWWNPAVEDQASDRAHRIGQKQPVTIYRLVTQDTIEEKILALHKTKRDLADSLLEGAGETGRISTDELMALLTV